MDACADSVLVAAWISGRLDPDATHALEAHADRCEACLQVLAAVGKLCADPHSRSLGESHGAPALAHWAMLLAAPRAAEATPMPDRISRYTLRGILGAGGFGVVYDAHDRELDRPVAIKAVGAGHDDGALRAEARALAALSHPNVVAVYDVVETRGHVYLVMEQIRGETLRQWQRRHRTGAQIIGRYLAVAAGLVAIHDAGLVHADIKPDNLLLADDGRVLVADFGLSRGGPTTDAAPAFAGTPRYMAPEQAAGRTIDARADQYAFCVTLHEALHGALPGQAPQRTSSRRVRAVLQRGLQRDPARRWPSMARLAEALRAAAEPAPRWWPAAAVLAAVVAVAPWASTSSSAAPVQPDDPAVVEPVALVSSAASEAIERAALQRNAGDLVGALDTLLPAVDGELGGTPLVQVRARHEMGRTLAAMHRLEARTVLARAHDDAIALRADLLAAMISIDLAEGEAETPATTGAARTWLRTADAELRRIDIDPHRHGEWVAATAQVAEIAGEHAEAAHGFARATVLLAEMDPVARVRAHTRWASVLGKLGEHDRALSILDEAEALCAIAGLQTSGERIEVRRAQATVLQHLGRFDDAAARIDEALVVADAMRGFSDAGRSHLHGDLGVFHLQRGDADGSARNLRRALELAPDSWVAHNNLSLHYGKTACRLTIDTPGCDPEAADLGYAHQLRAVELARDAFGEAHPTFATMRANLARSLLDRGELERAREHYVAACDQLAAHFGAEARQLMSPLYGLVEVHVRLGMRAQAVDAAQRLRAVAHGTAMAGRADAIAVLEYVVGRTLLWHAPRDGEASAMRTRGRQFFGDTPPDDFLLIDAWFD